MGTYASTAGRPSSEFRGAGSGLSRRARGSVTLSARDAQPRPLAAWVRFLSVDPASAKRARDWAALFLACCRVLPVPDTDTTVLVVSELTANAITAMTQAMACGRFTGLQFIELSLRLFPGRLLIEVIDSSREIPRPRLDQDPDAAGGRGLAVVGRVSDAWGWHWHMGRNRKVVWCELAVSAGRETDGGR